MLGLPFQTTDTASTNTYTNYLDDGRVSMSFRSNVISVQRSYDPTNQRLSSITRGGYIPGVTGKQNQTYGFSYDAFGNVTAIRVGTRTLAGYTYAANDGLLTQQSYGNGDSVQYTYDALGRKTGVAVTTVPKDPDSYLTTESYAYRYNGDGQLHEMTDTSGGLTYRYSYDSIGRLIGSELRSGTNTRLQTWHRYDTANRLSSQVWRAGASSVQESYEYDAHGRLTAKGVTLANDDTANISLGYDSLSRLSSVTTPVSQDY